ncbi:MAG: glycosyltransferase [Spirosomataceae bacterium]
MKILFLTARLPYPPFKGDQVIPYHRLRLLSSNHAITLVSFYEKESDLSALTVLQPFCEKIIPVKLSKSDGIINMLRYGLFSRCPFQVLYYTSRAFKRALDSVNPDDFDLIHTYMLRIAHYTPLSRKPRVLELIDSMELNFRRRLLSESWYWKPLVKEEIRRLQRYERRMAEQFEAAVVVSETDKATINHPNTRCIPLGVDVSVFYPTSKKPEKPTVVFSGNMSYYVNEKSIIWFIDHCWERIKAEVPGVQLKIIGAHPGKKLLHYSSDNSILITGFVPSLADELRTGHIAIAPMQSGSGMQNKVLEAMACGLPVVCTSLGLGMIKAKHKKEVLSADEAEAFAESCIYLLTNEKERKEMGQRAYKLVKESYTWEVNAERINRLYRELRVMSDE